ncbi:hypothetical protein Taro_013565 [Colocasia esculenta]|uniref:Uncharacterized protein n=1 Tax=Colocasia esculenta TaxID=4460 RepID=A0A843UGB3_COLES|nr:hypothetical protein [Colocasia esculenta]
MAATCTRIRSTNRGLLSSLLSHVKPRASVAAPSQRLAAPAGTASPASHFFGLGTPILRFTSLSRCSSELGCCFSMLPLYSAVAEASMRSRLSSASQSCRAISQGWSISSTVTDWVRGAHFSS